jgi:AraC-like DNA-binding protein
VGEFVGAPGPNASPGDVLVLRLNLLSTDPVGADVHELAAHVRDLRARFPGSPVAVWIPEAPLQAAVDAVRAAARAQVRAVLGGPVMDAELLRAQLTHPLELSAFVLRWASDAGYLPPGMEHEDVRGLLDAAPDVRTLERLALDRQVAARTWRSRLQQLGLPNPAAWLALAHALHIAFFVQRNTGDSLQALSERLGMLTVANMSQQFRRVFGLTPGQVRGMLGAEPLLHRWFQSRPRAGLRAEPATGLSSDR